MFLFPKRAIMVLSKTHILQYFLKALTKRTAFVGVFVFLIIPAACTTAAACLLLGHSGPAGKYYPFGAAVGKSPILASA